MDTGPCPKGGGETSADFLTCWSLLHHCQAAVPSSGAPSKLATVSNLARTHAMGKWRVCVRVCAQASV